MLISRKTRPNQVESGPPSKPELNTVLNEPRLDPTVPEMSSNICFDIFPGSISDGKPILVECFFTRTVLVPESKFARANLVNSDKTKWRNYPLGKSGPRCCESGPEIMQTVYAPTPSWLSAFGLATRAQIWHFTPRLSCIN